MVSADPERGTIMKTMSIALMLVLSIATAAEASVWDFSWVSEWTGRTATPDRGVSSASGQASGQGTATITPTPDGAIVHFDTPAGPAQFGVDRDQLGFYPDNRLPFNVPADNAVGSPSGLQVIPREPQAFPYGRDFAWTGDFANPDSFKVDAISPGSGPSPRLHFSGTGTRRVEATSPGVAGILTAALGALIWLRHTGRV
jgi:hypothetical protein